MRLRGIATLVLLTAAAIAVMGWRVVDDHIAGLRAEAEHEARAVASAQLLAVRRDVERTLETVLALHRVGTLMTALQPSDQNPMLHRIRQILDETASRESFGVMQFALADSTGRVVWSTAAAFSGVDLADREHFRVHRDGVVDRYVSAPVVGRITGRWSVQITRAIRSQDGRLEGVLVVSLDPDALSTRMRELLGAAGGSLSLLRDADAVILATSEESGRLLGQRSSAGDWLSLSASSPGEVIQATRPPARRDDNPNILLSASRIAEWPLVLVHRLDLSGMDGQVEQRRRRLLLALGGAIATAILSILLLYSVVNRARAQQDAKRARKEARHAAALLDSLPGAPYRSSLAPDGRWLRQDLSRAMCRLLDCQSPADNEEGWHDLGRPSAERARFHRQLTEVGEASAEYAVLRPDGSRIWLLDRARLVGYSEQGAIELVGILTDITRERQMQVKAMTAAKLATLGEMATGVAHELSQPCAAIALAADIGLMEMDRNGADSPATLRRMFEEIALYTMRLRDTVDHFRIFSRGEGHAADGLSLHEAAAGALGIARGSLIAAGIQIKLSVADDLPRVSGSRIPFEQVLVNLLINARDAMRDQAPADRWVELAALQSEDGRTVLVTLRDSGPGLSEDLQERVFEPFFTTKPIGEGTGLGLAIAYGTVRAAGGTIAIANHPAGGAVVTIVLPVLSSAESR
jgi:C4-dicarboxylate-specific signal transduction histidine kinase